MATVSPILRIEAERQRVVRVLRDVTDQLEAAPRLRAAEVLVRMAGAVEEIETTRRLAHRAEH